MGCFDFYTADLTVVEIETDQTKDIRLEQLRRYG